MAADASLWRPNKNGKLYISRQSFPTLQDSENGIAKTSGCIYLPKRNLGDHVYDCPWNCVKTKKTWAQHSNILAFRLSDLWCSQCRSNFAKRIKQCKKESGLWVFWHYWSVLSGSLHDPIRAASFSTVLSGFPFTFHSGKLPNVAKFDQYRSIIKWHSNQWLQGVQERSSQGCFMSFHSPGCAIPFLDLQTPLEKPRTNIELSLQGLDSVSFTFRSLRHGPNASPFMICLRFS